MKKQAVKPAPKPVAKKQAPALSPWMHPTEIAAIETTLKPHHVMLEWGSGGSTLRFAPLVKHYISIEHNKGWHDKVRKAIGQAGLHNVALHFIPHDQNAAPYIEFPTRTRHRFDRVLVDGRSRPECATFVLDHLAPDALVFIHDFYMPGRQYYHSVLDHYDVVKAVTHTPQTLVVLRRKPTVPPTP